MKTKKTNEGPAIQVINETQLFCRPRSVMSVEGCAYKYHNIREEQDRTGCLVGRYM